jgi:hypothetical protein
MDDHWGLHGPYTEAIAWCKRLLEAEMPESVTRERAMLRYMAASYSIWSSNQGAVEAASYYQAALADFRTIGDQRRASWCLNGIGNEFTLLGQFDSARSFHAANLAQKPRDTPDFDAAMAASRVVLAAAVWDVAWAEGATMAEEELLAYASGDEPYGEIPGKIRDTALNQPHD